MAPMTDIVRVYMYKFSVQGTSWVQIITKCECDVSVWQCTRGEREQETSMFWHTIIMYVGNI